MYRNSLIWGKVSISLLFTALLVVSGLCEQVNLTGTVTSSAGGVVANAKVNLLGDTLSALTNSEGIYHLAGEATLGIINPGKNHSLVRLSSEGLFINLIHDDNLTIEIFNLAGRKLARPVSGRIQRGVHYIPLNLSGTLSSVFILRIVQNAKVMTYKLLDLSSFQVQLSSPVLAKAAASYTLEVSATGYVTKQKVITALTGTEDVVLDPLPSEFSISIDKSSPIEVFGASKIEAALKSLNITPLVVDRSAATGQEQIQLKIVTQNDDSAIKKEGFRISKSGGAHVVTAIDNTGAMYGLMELAEQIQMKGLNGVAEKVENPRFEFRALKFNLPWESYRSNEALTINRETCKTKEFWNALIDMMAEDRLNVLTLWSLHPFPYFIKATNFPKATPFSDSELAEWRDLWTNLFKRAKDRGIDTYVINWNIIVSNAFKNNYGEGNTGLWADGKTSTQIEKYTRESVTQIINEYPNLTGLGISPGEAMQNWDAERQADWFKITFAEGMKAANRVPKFIYRASLDNDNHTAHRAGIDYLGNLIPGIPIYVEIKFNWSHGHTTTTLVKVHGGGKGEPYYEPPPTHHKMAWMIRNEDFFRLRWGEPDFIREHIQKNGQDYVGGYFIGSECLIPAKDIFHKPGHSHVNWSYAFERQWLYYMQWGRLLYNPAAPDAVFANEFNQRFGGNVGASMVEAYKLSTRTTQRIAQSFNFTWDHSFYTEGFIGNNRDFIDINEMMNNDPIEPNFVSINEYGSGGGNYGTKVTPLQLADSLVADNQQALSIVNGISTTNETLKCEIADVKAWAHLGLYFAKKLRACVAVKQNKKSEAVTHITEAQQHWRDLVTVTDEHIQSGDLAIVSGNWHWKDYQDDVDADVNWVKSR